MPEYSGAKPHPRPCCRRRSSDRVGFSDGNQRLPVALSLAPVLHCEEQSQRIVVKALSLCLIAKKRLSSNPHAGNYHRQTYFILVWTEFC